MRLMMLILSLCLADAAIAGNATSTSYSLEGASVTAGGIPEATALSSGRSLGASAGTGGVPASDESGGELLPGFWPIVLPEPGAATGVACGVLLLARLARRSGRRPCA